MSKTPNSKNVYIYTAQQKFSTDFNTMSLFEWTWTILFNVINMYGDLEIYIFFVSARQKVIWLGVSGSTLNLMSWACKWYTPTSEIKKIYSRVKPKVHNDEKR